MYKFNLCVFQQCNFPEASFILKVNMGMNIKSMMLAVFC